MLESFNDILGKIENQSQLQGAQEFQRLEKAWSELVGRAVADQTRPCSISRDVLYVAASSSVWVQDLKFQRRSILKKLNALLSNPLNDIHFSTSQWQKDSTPIFSENAAALWQEHPSRVVETSALPVTKRSPHDLHSMFQNWAKLVQARSQSLPLCPECQCPTPPGELERWRICGLCAVKQWQL